MEKNKWIQEVTPFINLWKSVCVGIDAIDKKFAKSSLENAIDNFIDLELSGALNLLNVIHADIELISKISRGLVLMTNDIHQVIFSLIKGETPSTWSGMWEGPVSVSDFMKYSVEKTLLIDKNRQKLANGIFFTEKLQLSDFMNPISLINAQRQQTSRECNNLLTVVNVSMDSLILATSWNNMDLKDCPVKFNIHGLLIQGCSFDGSRLLEATSNDPIFTTVPNFYLGWIEQESYIMKNKFEIPVYSNPSREQKVFSLTVPCDDPTPWVLAGVACFVKA